MTCKTCKHRKWVLLQQDGGNWTICGCTLKKWRFGQESDLKLNKPDKSRNIVAMPETCAEFAE